MILRFLMTVFLVWPFFATASAHKAQEYTTLPAYVDGNCSKGCVDPEVLLASAVNAAEETNLDFRLILAIVRLESSFQIHARNKKSVGLMQLNMRYHQNKFDNRRYTDPGGNIRAGALVMAECLAKNKQVLRKAALCYNGGGNPQYYKKLMTAYREIKHLSFIDDEEKDEQ